MSHEPSGSAECKICEQPAHGVHFGVTSCRACAAFFRRSTVFDKKYTCRRADSKCKVEKLLRDFCRYCRLQKCKSLGMTEGNVQRNRDPISSVQKSVIVELPGSKHQSNTRPLLNIMGMLDGIARSFDKFQLPENDGFYMSKNSLERMDYALQIYRENQKTEDLEFVSSFNFVEFVSNWGSGTCRVADWMMHSEEFRNLESTDKIEIFGLIWMIWIRFERLTMTLDIFGQQAIDQKIFLMSDTQAMYMYKIEIDISMVSDHESKKIRDIFDPVSQKMFDEVAKPLLELEPTTVEVAYMLCHIFWNAAGKQFQGKILSAGEKFLEKASNDLHIYYVKKWKMSNYASRLARMMGIVRAMQRNHKEREQMFELARLFDIFKVKLTEPIDLLQG